MYHIGGKEESITTQSHEIVFHFVVLNAGNNDHTGMNIQYLLCQYHCDDMGNRQLHVFL